MSFFFFGGKVVAGGVLINNCNKTSTWAWAACVSLSGRVMRTFVPNWSTCINNKSAGRRLNLQSACQHLQAKSNFSDRAENKSLSPKLNILRDSNEHNVPNFVNWHNFIKNFIRMSYEWVNGITASTDWWIECYLSAFLPLVVFQEVIS